MLKLHVDGTQEQDIDFFTFNGGEESVRITSDKSFARTITIDAKLKSSSDFMRLAMLKNAVDIKYKSRFVTLKMHYIPYARQDRVCNDGEALSIKVFCSLINSLSFDEVEVVDPHSDVAPALINNVKVVKQTDVIKKSNALVGLIKDTNTVIVSPDAGANKKTIDVCQKLGGSTLVRADKARDLSTGAITETIVYTEDLAGKNAVIIDDICDGGYTFIKLAEVLKSKGANIVVLYVTHGIFSKGLDVFDGLIDYIYTTNSYCSLDSSKKLKVFEL